LSVRTHLSWRQVIPVIDRQSSGVVGSIRHFQISDRVEKGVLVKQIAKNPAMGSDVLQQFDTHVLCQAISVNLSGIQVNCNL